MPQSGWRAGAHSCHAFSGSGAQTRVRPGRQRQGRSGVLDHHDHRPGTAQERQQRQPSAPRHGRACSVEALRGATSTECRDHLPVDLSSTSFWILETPLREDHICYLLSGSPVHYRKLHKASQRQLGHCHWKKKKDFLKENYQKSNSNFLNICAISKTAWQAHFKLQKST